MNNSSRLYDDYGSYIEANDNEVNDCEGIIENNGVATFCESPHTNLVETINGDVYLCAQCEGALDPSSIAWGTLIVQRAKAL